MGCGASSLKGERLDYLADTSGPKNIGSPEVIGTSPYHFGSVSESPDLAHTATHHSEVSHTGHTDEHRHQPSQSDVSHTGHTDEHRHHPSQSDVVGSKKASSKTTTGKKPSYFGRSDRAPPSDEQLKRTTGMTHGELEKWAAGEHHRQHERRNQHSRSYGRSVGMMGMSSPMSGGIGV